MAGRFTRDNQSNHKPLWQQLAGMSNTEWADFHEKFTALPLSEKFRGASQIHNSFSDYIGQNRDRRFSEADATAYNKLSRTLYNWTKIDQKPTHEAGLQTALAEAIAGDALIVSAAENWKSLETTQKLAAMDRVQQLHAHIYGIEAAPNITVSPRYMNAGFGRDACYNHDHLSPERCEIKLFDDTMGHFGDAVTATLHGASLRLSEHQRITFFGGSDDVTDPAAVQGSMFHMDYFTGGDAWGHEEGEFQSYISRPIISYARETAGAVMAQLQNTMKGAETTITDTRREAVYRLGKIEEHLTDGRIHDRDRSLMRKIAAISDMPDEQIAALSTGLKAHILADLQYEAAAYTHDENDNTREKSRIEKQAFALGNRITCLTELEPDFLAHQQKLEEELVARLRHDPDIAKARDNWKKMGDEERLGVFDKAITMHAEIFGYEKPDIQLMNEEMNETGTMVNGLHYAPHGKHPAGLIKLNTHEKASFQDFQRGLNTALHEATHAHQTQLAAKFRNNKSGALNPAEKNQARQFFWTTNHAFYGYARQIGFDRYKEQQIEKHAFTQGAVLSARIATKPDLRERIDNISHHIANMARNVGRKLSPPQRKAGLNSA